MTEAEWEASEDPGAMLDFLTRCNGAPVGHKVVPGRAPSDRKLRLFACAVEPMFAGSQHDEEADWAETLQIYLQPEITLEVQSKTEQAHLLRDIVGNPFRPVSLPGERLRCDCGGSYQPIRRAKLPMSICSKCHADGPFYPDVLAGKPPAWFRCGQVTNLANAAYDHRDESTVHLDPVRLAILADALEEAGCCEPRLPLRVVISGRSGGHEWEVVGRDRGQEFLRHTEKTLQGAKRWAESNLSANGWMRWGGWGTSTSMDWQSRQPCLVADGLAPATIHPILAHLRSPGPHVRGCWAIDLLTGRE